MRQPRPPRQPNPTLIYNSIAGALGAPHRRKCGIPQGSPLSVIYQSLYLRAWVVQMKSFGAMPRTLADNLMLLVTGNQALHIFCYAFTATLDHLTALGGRLSAHKSRLFSTIETHRKWLAAYVWPVAQQQVTVTHNMRDLGAAPSFAKSACTSYSAACMWSGIATLFAIRRLPVDRDHKGFFSLAAAHNKSFYSCELSQVDQA